MVAKNARILEGVGPDNYHELPGFSASCAKTVIERSPLHAWNEHPAFGAKERKATKEMDRGSVIHALTLGKGKGFDVLDFPDWRTKAAQEARAASRKSGAVPILADAFQDASMAAAAIVIELANRGIDLDGESELAIQWEEETAHGPLSCRGMFDHVWLDRGIILDLKVTGDAAPAAVERNAENMGYAIQAHAYPRALAALRPELAGRIQFLFAFCEPDPPHAMNLCQPDGLFKEIGERRWTRAVNTWAKCLHEQRWPSFGSSVNFLSAPMWAVQREEYQP